MSDMGSALKLMNIYYVSGTVLKELSKSLIHHNNPI